MMTTTTRRPPAPAQPPEPVGPPVAGATLDLLDRARACLMQACHSRSATDRYTQAHLGALRAGAALVLARTAPAGRSRPRSVWELLPAVAPELTEWAVFFAGSGKRRVGLESGTATVSAREADDLVRQGEAFLELVRAALHLPFADPLPGVLTPMTAR